jgi:predicted small secreted protein
VKTGLLAIALLVASSAVAPVYGQVGQDLKNAGKDTKDAAKTGAKKTAKGTKKGAKATKDGVKKGTHKTADKVADKTDTDSKK